MSKLKGEQSGGVKEYATLFSSARLPSRQRGFPFVPSEFHFDEVIAFILLREVFHVDITDLPDYPDPKMFKSMADLDKFAYKVNLADVKVLQTLPPSFVFLHTIML